MKIIIDECEYCYVVELLDETYGHVAHFTNGTSDQFCRVTSFKSNQVFETLEKNINKCLCEKYLKNDEEVSCGI